MLICSGAPAGPLVVAMSLLMVFAGGRAAGEDAPDLAVSPFDAQTARRHQERWARHLDRPVELRNSLGMVLMLIPPGEFLMGSTDLERQWARIQARFRHSERGLEDAIANIASEAPQQVVHITRPFYLGAHEVTVGQFRRFVLATGHETESEKRGTGTWGWDKSKGAIVDPKYSWRNPGFSQDETHPVVNVSWHNAMGFCRWLSEQEGQEYRLPTEAEWEYACRAGTTTRFYHGDDPEGLVTMANISDATFRDQFPRSTPTITARDGYAFTAPVGLYGANGFGLFDMHGNVWEWCAGSMAGAHRIARGGAWVTDAWNCRSANRVRSSPNLQCFSLGFRVALAASEACGKQETEN